MTPSRLLDRMSLRRSVMLALLLALIGVITLTAVGVYQSQRSRLLADELSIDVKLARAAGMVDMMHDALRSDALSALIAGPSAADDAKAAIRKDVRENGDTLGEQLKLLRDLGGSQLGEASQAAIAKAEAYRSVAARLVEQALTDPAEAQRLRPAFEAAFDELEQELGALSASIEQAAEQHAGSVETVFDRMARLLTAAVLLSAAALFVLWVVSQGLLTALRHALRVARAVADGDLAAPIDVRGTNEAGQLMQALRDMNEHLSSIVRTVRGRSQSVADASDEFVAGHRDLECRTHEQSSHLQATAASMQQLEVTVQRNAQHVRSTEALAKTAAEVARQGAQAVSTLVQTMGAIESSSRRIAEHTAVVDGIAFQTNLLALNAAVEAARAGAHGRGFAVVASEVRQLATRSAEAAREIRTLIGSSQEQVLRGSEETTVAGRTMQEVLSTVERVSALAAEISAAGVEQSEGVAQVTHAVLAMDGSTQRNATLAQKSAKASAGLREEAGALVHVVAGFRLG